MSWWPCWSSGRPVPEKAKSKDKTAGNWNRELGTLVLAIVVATPREFAKTTITSFGYVLHQIAHHLRHFIIIASDTEDLASDLAGNGPYQSAPRPCSRESVRAEVLCPTGVSKRSFRKAIRRMRCSTFRKAE